jgi:protein O-mannosyl-transferase
MGSRNQLTTAKVVLFMICLGLAVFGNGLKNGFVGDDIPQITDNATIHSVTNIATFFTGSTFFGGSLQKLSGIYYKPILLTYYSAIYSIVGQEPFLFHLVQLGLHIGGAIFLFLVLKNFFKKPLAFVSAVIFLIHPINSEAVFYISDTQDVMFFFFGILGLWILTRTKTKKMLIPIFVSLFLAVLAKETGVLFLGVILLYSFIFKRKYFSQTLAGAMIVFGGYLWLRIHALGSLVAKSNPIAPIEKLNLAGRMINIPEILIFYLKTFIFPLKLSYSYNWAQKGVSINHFFIPLIICIAFFGGLVYLGLVLRKEKFREYFKIYIFFGIWFAMGLAIHAQILSLDVTVADRWFYFSMAGLLGMGATIVQAFNLRLTNKKTELGLIVVILLLLSARTIVRSFDYKDEFTLDDHDVRVSTDDYNLENGMASDLLKRGQIQEARVHSEKSIKLNPYWSNYNTLGSIYLSQGEYERARQAYMTALSYLDYYQIYENIAGLTLATGKYEDNIYLVKSYINKFPQSGKLWLYLAILQYNNKAVNDAKISITAAQKFNYFDNPEIAAVYNIIMNDKPLILNLMVGKSAINKSGKSQ